QDGSAGGSEQAGEYGLRAGSLALFIGHVSARLVGSSVPGAHVVLQQLVVSGRGTKEQSVGCTVVASGRITSRVRVQPICRPPLRTRKRFHSSQESLLHLWDVPGSGRLIRLGEPLCARGLASLL